MRQKVIASSLFRRVSHGPNLLMVGLVGGIFCLFHLFTSNAAFRLVEMAPPFILLLGHLALAPIPWQWTGDDQPRTGLGRGFLQGLVFNAAWIGLLLFATHLLWTADRPQPGPPPRPLTAQAGSLAPPGFPPGPPNGPHPDPHRPPRPFNPGFGLGLMNVAFGLIFGWVSAEKEASQARERLTADLLRQSQSKALQNQLEPHVLYNALNGLSELVHEDPLAAEEVVVRLADLYRMLTSHGEAPFIPLGQERRLVEAYLAMEQMRFGDRLRVEWIWPDWPDAVPMPPLFLQPLVENAIKHGISPCAEGGRVVISCGRDGAETVLRVENTGQPLAPGRTGVGLGNLQARLRLWTEVEASFTLEPRGEWAEATLRWKEMHA